MRMLDIIIKKRENKELTPEEIRFFVNGYVDGTIPDYQASAFPMAVVFTGLTTTAIGVLTDAMLHSGDVIDE